MMLVKIENNKIVANVTISNKERESDFLKSNSDYIRTDFNFVEDMSLYEYSEENGTFSLISGWEQIKADKEEALRIANTPTLEELKEIKISQLNRKANEQYRAYLSKYPEIEIDSFKEKAKETALVMLDNNVALEQTPYLSGLTGNTSIEARNTLAFAVNAKVQETAQLEAYAVSKRDEIKVCTTIEELEAVEI